MGKCRCNKIQYEDKKGALTAMNQIAHRTRKMKTVPTRAYQCPTSNMWHLTSDTKEKGKLQPLILGKLFKKLIDQ